MAQRAAAFEERTDPYGFQVAGRHTRGFGQSLSDFAQIAATTPKFSQNWDDISKLLTSEGFSSGDITAARISFTGEFEGLVNKASDLSADQVSDYAKQFVVSGRSVVGAIQNVQGLFNPSSVGADPIQVTQVFTGTLIGFLAAAGALSGVATAGVGTAIMAATGAVIGMLQALGVVGPPKEGFFSFNVPTIVPGSLAWNKFPDPNNAADAAWFGQCMNQDSSGRWGCAFTDSSRNMSFESRTPSGVNPATYNMRPIDYLPFGNPTGYSDIEYLSTHPDGPSNFTASYIGAWKANAEYVLNGMRAQADADVFIHFVRLWNRSHLGPVVPLSTWPTDYYKRFIDPVVYAKADDILTGRDVAINGGALRPVSSVSTALSGAPKSAAAKVAAPAAVLGLGVLAYAWIAGHSVDFVLSRLWKEAKRFVYRVAGEAEHLTPNPLGLFERQSTTVQSLLFPRPEFSPSSARSWARRHGYRAGKVHSTGDYVRLRQHPPSDFKRGSFRTISFGSSGIKAVIGRPR